MHYSKQLMDQLEDSQQHFDKTVQAALSDALFSTLYPLGQLFSQEKAILFLNFASQSDLAFHHNVYMTPQCVNIRYPYKEHSTPSISKILQNPVWEVAVMIDHEERSIYSVKRPQNHNTLKSHRLLPI